MSERPERAKALAWSLVFAAATVAPYLLAAAVAPPGTRFTGFLINPVDGFSYLAKMRQGFDGALAFTLPYALEPGPPALLFVYHLLLGHLSRLVGLPLIFVYHGARAIASLWMAFAAQGFYGQALRGRGDKGVAFALTVFGGGLGWLLVPLGRTPVDLAVPEATPYLLAYANAHFPFAAALLLTVAGRWAAGAEPGWVELLVGFLLGAVYPFAAVVLVAAALVWLSWERVGGYSWVPPGWSAPLFLGLGAAPWGLYDLWITRAHPVLALWSRQNQTPSPPPVDYLVGYGVVLAFALLGLALARPWRWREGRLLLSWVIVNAGLLFAPFSLQRRFALGLFFPLAALAAIGISRLAERTYRWGWASLAVGLSLPSVLLVVALGVSGVARGEPLLVFEDGELQAYRWLADHAPRGSRVMAGPRAGNRLPAFADLRVVYGHPFETPFAPYTLRRVRAFYGGDLSPAAAQRLVMDLNVDFVFLGSEERQLGGLPQGLRLDLVYRSQDVEVYAVSED